MKLHYVRLEYSVPVEWQGSTHTILFDVLLSDKRVTVHLCDDDYLPEGFFDAWRAGMPDLEQQIRNHHHATQLREWAEFLEGEK